MRHALVTGGAGFIGSHLVDTLLSQGWRVTVIDNMDPFYSVEIKRRNLQNALQHPQCSFREIDIRDWEALMGLEGPFEVIVHLAAKAGVRPSIAAPLEYQDVNVRGTQTLLEFARHRKINQFIFASSSSVYGVNPNVPWSEANRDLLPISPYAATKLAGEFLGHVYSTLYGIRFIALRFFTVYGPRQRPDLAIHRFAKLMLENKPIPVYGDGRTRRDYTYIGDTIQGIVRAIEYTGSPFEVINLGNDHTVSLSEMISELGMALGVEPKKQFLPEQPGDVPQTWADISYAKRLLGYEPSTSFSSGIAQFAHWFRSENF